MLGTDIREFASKNRDGGDIMPLMAHTVHARQTARFGKLSRFCFTLHDGKQVYLTVTEEAAKAIRGSLLHTRFRRHYKKAAEGNHKSVRWVRRYYRGEQC